MQTLIGVKKMTFTCLDFFYALKDFYLRTSIGECYNTLVNNSKGNGCSNFILQIDAREGISFFWIGVLNVQIYNYA